MTRFTMIDRANATVPTIESVTVETPYDLDPDLSWLEQTDDDMGDGFEDHASERLAAYHAGDWHMVGVRAVATIAVPIGGAVCLQTIESPGLWGIESDSGDTYLAEVAAEELDTLRAMLSALGFDNGTIDAAFQKVA